MKTSLRTLGLITLFTCGAIFKMEAQVDGGLLNSQTVKITVDFLSGGPAVGSGIIIKQVGNTAYILTAKHVLQGSSDGPRRPAKQVTIDFYRNRLPSIEGRLIQFKARFSQRRDIALLQIDLGDAAMEAIPIGRSAEVKALDPIFTTGHSAAKSRDWLAQNGIVNSAGELILHSANLEEGYSGSPLVNNDGVLIGMNTEIDGAGGSTTTGAIPVDEILTTIKEWVDISPTEMPPAGEPTVERNTRQHLAEDFKELAKNRRAQPSAYLSWLDRAETVLEKAAVSEDLKGSFELTKEEIVYELRESGSAFDRENVNYYLQEILDTWEREESGGIVPSPRPGPAPAPSAADAITGSYSLVNYRDLTSSWGPPVVTGQLEMVKTGSNNVSFSFSTQAPLIGLYVSIQVTGVYDGSTLSGTITQTNLANHGAPWAATVTHTESGMIWNFANGEVWTWEKNL